MGIRGDVWRGDDVSSSGPATEGLAARSARGGALTVSAQGVRFVLTLGSTAVLARLLTPNDYGLIAFDAAGGLAQLPPDALTNVASAGLAGRSEVDTEITCAC